jgi:hypothetical protein
MSEKIDRSLCRARSMIAAYGLEAITYAEYEAENAKILRMPEKAEEWARVVAEIRFLHGILEGPTTDALPVSAISVDGKAERYRDHASDPGIEEALAGRLILAKEDRRDAATARFRGEIGRLAWCVASRGA